MMVIPDTHVPENEEPAAKCPYCDRPFRRERERNLHVGEEHTEECTENEREAHDRADEEEVDELFVYHMKVVATIALIYSAFVIAFMVLAG